MPVDQSNKVIFAPEYRRYDRKSLLPVFAPKDIVMIGVEDKANNLGRMALWNLIRQPFGGTVSPVNPKIRSVLGIKTYPGISAIDHNVDLAIIANPAAEVPDVIDECVAKGVKGAIIVSSGFCETGDTGLLLEAEVVQRARAGNMRILGPNCAGFMMPHIGLNASIYRMMAEKGNVGFVSQSNSVSAAILDWSSREKVGFSTFISLGNMADIDWSDIIYYLGDHPQTQSIVMYVQSIRDARSFLSAAREVAFSKPIILLKSGQNDTRKQRFTDTPHELIRQEQVMEAAFRRSGILPVKSLVDLFAMSEVLSKQPAARGKKLTIVTNAGGASIQARSRLREGGGKMATFSDETVAQLKNVLPKDWIPENPVHVLRDADADRFAKTLEVLAKSNETDGILVILVAQANGDPTEIAKKLTAFAKINKPLLASWMGGDEVAEGKSILNNANIPTFPFPETAATIFNYLWKRTYNLRGLFETPAITGSEDKTTGARVEINVMIDELRENGVTELNAEQVKQVFGAFEIPIGGEPVADAYQLRMGSFTDGLFGPVLYCGTGGKMGKVVGDYAVALPPLNTTLARRMLEQARIFPAILEAEPSFNGNLAALEELLVKFSRLVIGLRWIKEIVIDPLDMSTDALRIGNVSVTLYYPEILPEQLPRPAIRPYPAQYIRQGELRDGTPYTLRPIRPEDEPLMVRFHERLSDRSVYMRYFYPINFEKRVSHDRLARICFIDYDREMVLVAEKKDPETGEGEIMAVGRLNKLRGVNEAEYAVTIDDEHQRHGLGTKILATLVEIGRQEGIDKIIADILPENRGMQRAGEKIGFKHYFDHDEQVVKAVLDLRNEK